MGWGFFWFQNIKMMLFSSFWFSRVGNRRELVILDFVFFFFLNWAKHLHSVQPVVRAFPKAKHANPSRSWLSLQFRRAARNEEVLDLSALRGSEGSNTTAATRCVGFPRLHLPLQIRLDIRFTRGRSLHSYTQTPARWNKPADHTIICLNSKSLKVLSPSRIRVRSESNREQKAADPDGAHGDETGYSGLWGSLALQQSRTHGATLSTGGPCTCFTFHQESSHEQSWAVVRGIAPVLFPTPDKAESQAHRTITHFILEGGLWGPLQGSLKQPQYCQNKEGDTCRPVTHHATSLPVHGAGLQPCSRPMGLSHIFSTWMRWQSPGDFPASRDWFIFKCFCAETKLLGFSKWNGKASFQWFISNRGCPSEPPRDSQIKWLTAQFIPQKKRSLFQSLLPQKLNKSYLT